MTTWLPRRGRATSGAHMTPFVDHPRRARCDAGLGRAAAAGDRDLARPDHLDQPEGANQLLEGGDLVVGAGHLDRYRALRHVHGLAAEDVRVLHDLGARVAV